MESLLEIIQFETDCISEWFSLCEGTTNDKLYMQCKVLEEPYYNSLFANTDLDQQTVESTSQRLQNNGLIPAFRVLPSTKNSELCKDLGLENAGDTVVMKVDLTDMEITEKDEPIKTGSLPYSEDFADVFEDAFLNNDGSMGYTLEGNWMDAIRAVGPTDSLSETTFTMYSGDEPASIVQTSLDIKNKRGFVFNVATKNKHRKKGYSSQLIRRAMFDAKEQGVEVLYLSTMHDSPLQTFYEKLGFSSIGNHLLFVGK